MVLTELCQQFRDALSSRAIRRHRASLYASAALTEQCRLHNAGAAPYSFAWILRALPDNKVLQRVVLRGFAGFVQARVRIMRRRQLAYNGQGLRHDGCFWLAKIIKGGKFTVALALFGADGSLLDVPQPTATESWCDIQSALRPLLT